MKNGVSFRSEIITPELAKELLSKNGHNRPVSQSNVEFLASQMLSGAWKKTGQTIQLSKTGKLLDGQHRLHAIIKANKPQEIAIAEGLEDEIFTVLDTGRTRTPGDILAIKGYTNAKNVASAARQIIFFKNGRFADHKQKTNVASNQQILEFVQKNPDLPEIINYVWGIQRKFRYLGLAVLTMLYFLLSKKNQTKADIFFEKLATGIDLSETSPIRILRERLIRDQINKTRLTSRDKTALFIMAWNAYLQGKKIQQLTLAKNYQFPKPL